MKVTFTVPGEPVGKGRHRTTKTGRTYTPAKTVNYENLVKMEYQRQCGKKYFEKGVPLDMRITAYFQIPASASKKKQQLMRDKVIRPTKVPDFDNLGKAIADGLLKVAFYDDAQVVDAQVRKFYSDRPRVVVTIQEADL